MTDTNMLHDLYRHMEWADALVWSAALEVPEAAGDAKLRELLHHIHVVQHAFFRVWRGEPRDAPYPTFDDLPSLMRWGRSYYADAAAYLGGLDDGDLARPLPVPWAEMVERSLGRAPETTTLGETAFQVPLHTIYHRGQVNARLRALGGEPPLVDYIAWIWLGRPAPEWPQR